MNKAKTPHKIIFPLYEFENKADYDKDTIRRYINKALKDEFGEKEWTELSDIQQKRFVCFTVRDTLIERYVRNKDQETKFKEKRIERNLNEYAERAMIEAQAELERYNERADVSDKQFYQETDNEEEKKKAYKDFCTVLKKYYSWLSAPTFQEWIDENKRALKVSNRSLSIFDYVNSSVASEEKEENNHNVRQEDINYVILKTLLKALKKELNIDIDVSKIEECLSFIDTIEEPYLDENGKIVTEYDPNRSIDRETQEKMIDVNIKFQKYETALKNLDFYKIIRP